MHSPIKNQNTISVPMSVFIQASLTVNCLYLPVRKDPKTFLKPEIAFGMSPGVGGASSTLAYFIKSWSLGVPSLINCCLQTGICLEMFASTLAIFLRVRFYGWMKEGQRSDVPLTNLLTSWALDIGHLLIEAFRPASNSPATAKLQALTKTLGEDNLVGSAGEFGLLYALLAGSPATKQISGEPALSVSDLTDLFVHHQLPNGWKNWKKSSIDWSVHSSALTFHAAIEYHRLRGKTV